MKFNTLSKLLYVIVNINGQDVQLPYSIFGNEKFIKIVINENDLKDALNLKADKNSHEINEIDNPSTKFLTVETLRAKYDINSPAFTQYAMLLNDSEREALNALKTSGYTSIDALNAFHLCDSTCKKLCDVLNLFNADNIKDIEANMYTKEAKQCGNLMFDELKKALAKGGCSSCKKRSIRIKYQKLLITELVNNKA